MFRRWGLGPVFAFEWLALSRRKQVYALRSLFVLALLIGMGFIWWSEVAGKSFATIRAQASVGQSYFYALVGTQLALVLLAAPAFTAGAVCLGRARGTLDHMLVTDLSDAEIVLGKLAARLVPVVGLVACALPTLSLGTLLGGMDPVAVGMSFLVTLASAVVACVLAYTLSIWARKTHEVLLATYAIIILVLLSDWFAMVLRRAGVVPSLPSIKEFNPFWLAFAPYWSPRTLGWEQYVNFFAVAFGLSATMVVLSVARLRAVAVRGPGRTLRFRRARKPAGYLGRLGRVIPGPSLDGNPVLWREWHRNRPSAWVRLIWLGFAFCVVVGGIEGMREMIAQGPRPGPTTGAWTVLLEIFVGLLLLSVSASTSLAEERVRGSLDVLLATTLPTRSIVWGKWWGAFRRVPLLAVWPVVYAAGLAFDQRPAFIFGSFTYGPFTELYAVTLMALVPIAHGAAITSLGLALATWTRRLGLAVALCVAAYLMIAIGWPILVEITFRGAGMSEFSQGLIGLSPFIGAVELCDELARSSSRLATILAWQTFWVIGLLTVAAGLLFATFMTFDRCLGRISDWSEELGGWPDLVAEPWPALGPEPIGPLTGSGWRTPATAGPPAPGGASSAPRPR